MTPSALRMQPPQLRDHLLRQAVAQVFLLRVAGQVHKRQDGQPDRRPARRFLPRSPSRRPPKLRPKSMRKRPGPNGEESRIQSEYLSPEPSLGLERPEAFGDGLEVLPELLHGLVAVGRLLGQGLAGRYRPARAAGRPYLDERLRLPVEDRIDDRLIMVPLEGQLAGEHFVEDDAQRPDVRPLVQLSPRACSGDM